MCHPDAPSAPSADPAAREEVRIPLGGGEELPCLCAHPERDGPGVLIVADIFGRSPFYEDLAARLATEGFHALLPDLFFREGPLRERSFEAAMGRRSQLDDLRALGDYSTAIDWLCQRDNVAGDRTGTMGFCMGGTFVLNLAAERDDLATVCYYGWPRPHRAGPNPSAAPVEQASALHGPIIGFWGDQDHGVGLGNVALLVETARSAGVDFEHTVYPGLGHGFLAQTFDSSDAPGHEHAVDSWKRALAFYRRHLDEGAA